MRILHVEDDADTRVLVALILEAEGWQVVSVTSKAEAISAARGESFDLYLIDNWIEDDQGTDLCVALRAVNSLTPILFYSGVAYPLDIQTALACGAQGYLTKPSTPQALVDEIRKVTKSQGVSES